MKYRAATLPSSFWRHPKPLLGFYAFVLACSYFLLSHKIDIGYFNDDARYITAAYSITQGHYQNLEQPGNSPNIDRLPGYPALLAPLVQLIKPRWSWLKLTSVLFSVLSCLLLAALFENVLNARQQAALLLLYGLNPTIAKYSCSVMPESCFLFFVLLSFVVFKKWLENQKNRPLLWLFHLTLSWAVLIRPEGLALAAAMVVGLLVHRFWRPAASISFVALAAMGSFTLRNYLFGASPSGYLLQWADMAAHESGHFWLWIENTGRTIYVMWVDGVLQVSFPQFPFGLRIMVSVAALAIALLVTLKGFRLQWRSSTSSHVLKASMGMFVLAYMGMHCIFLSVNSRYFFCLIPFFLSWMIVGAGERKLALVLALLFFYLNPWSSRADKLWAEEHPYRVNRQTFEQIRDFTPSDAYLLAIKASTVHLYTGRYAVSEIPSVDLEELRYRLLQEGVTYILDEPNRLMVLSGKSFLNMLSMWKTVRIWTQEWPEAYEKVYENADEHTVLYKVLPDAQYQKAYVLCLSADAEFSQRRWSQGLADLRQALALYPRFPGALNRYGLVLLLANRDRKGARQNFLQALKIRPDFAFALINMARLEEEEGDKANAQAYRSRAHDALMNVPSWSGDILRLKEMAGRDD